MTRVLLVEDEPNLCAAIAAYLTREQLGVELARTCAEARQAITGTPDVVILDWMLPDGTGVDLLRAWRAQGIRIPIIMLTARTELIDKVLGLELGANDYLTKPFEPRELLARIHVQLRSVTTEKLQPVAVDSAGIRLDAARYAVTFLGAPVELTRMEFALLKLLMENPGRVFSRDELLIKVWGFDHFPTTRTVDTHILQLRQKFSADLFQTVRGVGYRFVPAAT